MVDVLLDLVMPGTALAFAVTLVTLAYHLLRHLGRRSQLARDLVRRAYRPSQLVAALAAVWVALRLTADGNWLSPTRHVVLLAIIGASAWLVAALVNVVTDLMLRRLRLDERDPLTARRIRTRLKVSHRVTLASVSTLAAGVMLITFEDVRTVGVSLLASAGVIGVLVALAAQSMLSNMFAGLQVAFGDALRLDDVVVVEGEWGSIEEITLRHVVVKIWDERRLILPTSYFTTTPFQNWTKSEHKLLGTIELDVDWSVPFEDMRAQLRRIVGSTDLWDGRTCGLDVIDATGSLVRVWAVISAADSSAQWKLRCLVREQLVTWLQQQHPTALPRVRTEFGGALQSSGEPPPRWAAQPGQPAVVPNPRVPEPVGLDGAGSPGRA
ncbi:MAG: mechanosensitive ion channel [Micromonosporaceae bacterium]|nr:mechanosensitive ion channel [Micromonosporaceae bacterium]